MGRIFGKEQNFKQARVAVSNVPDEEPMVCCISGGPMFLRLEEQPTQ
jgi:hypothetical protein